MNIFVSNLGLNVQDEDLKKQFAPYGVVSLINIIMDKSTNRSKGFAFVGMRDRQSAEKAIRELDGISLDGRAMKVKEARGRDDRSSSTVFY